MKINQLALPKRRMEKYKILLSVLDLIKGKLIPKYLKTCSEACRDADNLIRLASHLTGAPYS
jgi:hypothetical protein